MTDAWSESIWSEILMKSVQAASQFGKNFFYNSLVSAFGKRKERLMRKRKKKIACILLMAGLLFMLMPQSIAMAGETEKNTFDEAAKAYEEASSAFWEAWETYNGTWDDNGNQLTEGAYDTYVAAAESGADNTAALYTAAQTARSDCEEKYSALTSAYTALNTAYTALDEDDKSADEREDTKNNYDGDYTSAEECMGNLAELLTADDYAARKSFYDAMGSYWTALDSYWNSMSGYYGADETTQGSYGNYMDALYAGASNVQELYETASADRAVIVSAFEKLQAYYDAAAAAYDALSDDAKDSEVQSSKADLDSSYADALQAENDLETLVAPEDFVADLGALSSIWIDANGNFGGAASAPAYWKVSESGKLVAATEDDWSLKYEKTAAGVTLTLRNFQFTSVATDGETELDAIWSDTSLILNVEGTNIITGTLGSAIGVDGDLTINGSGSLELYSTASEVVSMEGETYVPMALYVSGTLTNNGVTIKVGSNNTENAVWANAIVNTGYILPASGQLISANGTVYKKLEPQTEEYNDTTVVVNAETQTVSPQTGENSMAAGAAAVMSVAAASAILLVRRKMSE